MKGTGIAAALERIRAAFHQVHGDVRTRDDVRASRELEIELMDTTERELEKSSCSKAPTRVTHPQPPDHSKTERIANAYINAAVRSTVRTVVRRSNVHRAYFVGSIDRPQPDLAELYESALRTLEKDDR